MKSCVESPQACFDVPFPSVQLQPGEIERFRETQRFYSNHLLRILVPIEFVVITTIMGAVSMTVPAADQVKFWLIWFGAAVVLPGVIACMGMTTVVTDRRLLIRWFPPFPGRSVPLENISSAESVKYQPFTDTNGWGWKLSAKYHRVMSVAGDRGVHVRYGEGKNEQILIGTNRPDQLAESLRGQ